MAKENDDFESIVAPLKEELGHSDSTVLVHMASGLVHKFIGVSARQITKRLLQFGIVELSDHQGRICYLFASHVTSCMEYKTKEVKA